MAKKQGTRSTEQAMAEEAKVEVEIIQELNQQEVATVVKTKSITGPSLEIISKLNNLFVFVINLESVAFSVSKVNMCQNHS